MSRLVEKIEAVLSEGYVCNRCLGRQFGQLLSGMSNEARGRALRDALAMAVDAGAKLAIDEANLHDYKFHHSERKTPAASRTPCVVCNGLFNDVNHYISEALRRLKGLEFETFLVGTVVNSDLASREEELWERAGIDWCEPLKAEFNREVGSRLEKLLKKRVDFKRPEVLVLVNTERENVFVELNPLFVAGEYNKLVRGIPQTKWPSGKYKNSVEQIIAKPLMRATRGAAHKLHGMGREDIDARCLGWRPFIVEIIAPKKRLVKLKEVGTAVNKTKKVAVRNLRFAEASAVERLKRAQPEKSYRAQVELEKPLAPALLKKLAALKGKEIFQETPTRVLHRRADIVRKRTVRDIRWKVKGKKKLELVVRAQAGTYIKELISGDAGRTYPSVSELLGIKARCTELDVIAIHDKNY